MSSDQFADRRAALLARLGETIAIIPAGARADPQRRRRASLPPGFRLPLPHRLHRARCGRRARCHLGRALHLVRPCPGPAKEAWTGRRAGVEGAVERVRGRRRPSELDELGDWLRRRLAGRRSLGYALGGPTRRRGPAGAAFGAQLRRAVGRRDARQSSSTSARSCTSCAWSSRPPEIEALREACRISAMAHNEAMRFAAPGRSERQVQAVLEYVFGVMDAERVGYGSIVAGGDNACILHYVENDQPLAEGELLLVDAARRVPSPDRRHHAHVPGQRPLQRSRSGRSTSWCSRAQRAVIAECRPGLAWTAMHETAVEVLSAGLVELGLLPGSAEEVVAKGWYRQFFFHGTGHWLGIDVHDAGASRIEAPAGRSSRAWPSPWSRASTSAREKATVTLSHASLRPRRAVAAGLRAGSGGRQGRDRATGRRRPARSSTRCLRSSWAWACASRTTCSSPRPATRTCLRRRPSSRMRWRPCARETSSCPLFD